MPKMTMQARADAILQQKDHRPWPMPDGRWQLFMRWSELGFLHWPVSPGMLRRLVPAALEIDTFDDSAWVGVVPFRMDDTQFRSLPPVPTATTFYEINLRTYVRDRDRAGVWFFSLDAGSRLAVWGGRALFNLPYYRARFAFETDSDGVRYRSERTHRGAPQADFLGAYQGVGPVRRSAVGSIEHWLTERYCLYSQGRRGNISRVDVHHPPWPLQHANSYIEFNSMADAAGVTLPHQEPLAHYAAGVDVVAWKPERVEA